MNTWYVERDGVYQTHLTEAEAQIIAFALNAIADGHKLMYSDAYDDYLTPYDGPTEGVAPVMEVVPCGEGQVVVPGPAQRPLAD
jgi:hypothetical protein